MQTAFVTGATGFVGLNLVEALRARGVEVTCLHRPSSDVSALVRFEPRLVEGQLTDPRSVAAVMPEGVDAVFHIAGDTSQWKGGDAQQTRTNVEGTRSVVAAALQRGARRFVHTSSIAAYGLHSEPITEESPQTAMASGVNYMRTKFLAEVEVRQGIERGLEAVILNPAHILGPYDKGNWSRIFLLLNEDRLPGVPSGRGSFVHVREVVRAHINAVSQGRVGHNYLLGGVDHSYVELAEGVGRLLEKEVSTRAVPLPLLTVAAGVSDWVSRVTQRAPDITPEIVKILGGDHVCICTKAQTELGIEAVSLDDMLADCHAWLVDEGLL